MKTALFAIITVLAAAMLGALGQYYFKIGADTLKKLNIRSFINRYLLYAVILYIVSAVTYVIILPYGELSVLYPLVASNFIWVAIIARIKLQERITLWKCAGLFCIILGIILIGLGS